jgi:predicted ATP-grasp superfamily ATP-dependent carboligase
LAELQNKFPLREARIAPYIEGPLFTNNNIVWQNKILLGNINYQITGLKPFTDLSFATIGNDWALPDKILSAKQIKQYKKIATDVGQRMRRAGWQGLFGIDVVTDTKTGRLYLLEINARQPASTGFESQLQSNLKTQNITTFEAHLASLLKLKYDNYKIIKINNGAQIIQRVTDKIKIPFSGREKTALDVTIIKYNNNKLGADLLRIQSKKGIMSGHNRFNEMGKQIKNYAFTYRSKNY